MLLAGDWAPGTRRVASAAAVGDLLVNIEGPILPAGHTVPPAPKAGPHLFSTRLPPVEGALIACLANNHIMDFGAEGLRSTTERVRQVGGHHAGAGEDREDAASALFLDVGPARLAFLSRTEAQFGIARRGPGAAELDLRLLSTVRSVAQRADAVIVSCHGGIEDAPWPSPGTQDLYRAIIEQGAAVVHGHHAHVPQGYESYEGGLITYGLGNWCVDPLKWAEEPNALWSVVIAVEPAARPVRFRVETWVCEDRQEELLLRRSTAAERAAHDAHLAACNRPLADRGLLEQLWQHTAIRVFHDRLAGYLALPDAGARATPAAAKAWVASAVSRVAPEGPAARAQAFYRRLQYHVLACESLRSAATTALGILAGEIEDLRTPRSEEFATLTESGAAPTPD